MPPYGLKRRLSHANKAHYFRNRISHPANGLVAGGGRVPRTGHRSFTGQLRGDEVHRNSPYAITVVISLLSLCTIFAATVFSAGAVLRDRTYRMDALVFSTTIHKTTYLFVKFAGLLTVVFLLLCLAATGVLAGSFTLDATQRGPFNILHYLHPLLVFGLPNVILTCALLFSMSMITWNAKAVYAGGVLLYILYLTASIAGGSLSWRAPQVPA